MTDRITATAADTSAKPAVDDPYTSGQEPVLSVQNLSITFGAGKTLHKAVKNVSFDVYKGETFGIVGESGSGKTTIGRAIMRLYSPSEGAIYYKGHKISGKLHRAQDIQLARKIPMIFQDPMSSLNERAKVDYIVGEGLHNMKLDKHEINRRVGEALRAVGLRREFGSRFPHEFSGGQRQRIGIARALVVAPDFIVADEPISALDISIQAQVLNLMSKLQRERGLTYLFISHDLSVMRFICTRIAALHHGTIVELADSNTLFTRPLHPYTRSLLSAIPYPDPVLERSKQLIAYDPSKHDYSIHQPDFVEIEPGHFVYASEPELERYRTLLATYDSNN